MFQLRGNAVLFLRSFLANLCKSSSASFLSALHLAAFPNKGQRGEKDSFSRLLVPELQIPTPKHVFPGVRNVFAQRFLPRVSPTRLFGSLLGQWANVEIRELFLGWLVSANFVPRRCTTSSCRSLHFLGFATNLCAVALS